MKYDYKNVTYEWVTEDVLDGEIVGVTHLKHTPIVTTNKNTDWALVCEDWITGVKSWAYVLDGKLSSVFLNAYGYTHRKVPARYIKEFNNVNNKEKVT
mgnify:CR=1 FL=1|jgi:hypothetical protein